MSKFSTAIICKPKNLHRNSRSFILILPINPSVKPIHVPPICPKTSMIRSRSGWQGSVKNWIRRKSNECSPIPIPGKKIPRIPFSTICMEITVFGDSVFFVRFVQSLRNEKTSTNSSLQIIRPRCSESNSLYRFSSDRVLIRKTAHGRSEPASD